MRPKIHRQNTKLVYYMQYIIIHIKSYKQSLVWVSEEK